jgi:hypothetical protein
MIQTSSEGLAVDSSQRPEIGRRAGARRFRERVERAVGVAFIVSGVRVFARSYFRTAHRRETRIPVAWLAAARGETLRQPCGDAAAPNAIMQERSGASRLRSLRSPRTRP